MNAPITDNLDKGKVFLFVYIHHVPVLQPMYTIQTICHIYIKRTDFQKKQLQKNAIAVEQNGILLWCR
jgi:hypothetical protein